MSSLKIAFHDDFVHPLPSGHRFPMEKYDLLVGQLLHEGTIDTSNLFAPNEIKRFELTGVHTEAYLDKLFALDLSASEQRRSGFAHNDRLIRREKRIMEGTRRCAEEALQCGVAMNIAGGTHHAYADRPEGFCLLNDQAIAADFLLRNKLKDRILIVDLDVHQGNGTASIFRNNDAVFTFSMHGKHNYPLKKEESNLDIELIDGTGDDEYLYLLEKNLSRVIESFQPDFIFYQSGVDVLASDKLGRLALSTSACKQRDRFVLNTAKQLNVPLVGSMGGGYSPDIKEIVEAHANTFRLAQEIFF